MTEKLIELQEFQNEIKKRMKKLQGKKKDQAGEI